MSCPTGPVSWGLWAIPNGLYGLAVVGLSVIGSVIFFKTLNPNFRFKILFHLEMLWRLIFCTTLTIGLILLLGFLFEIILSLLGLESANQLMHDYWKGLLTFVIPLAVFCGGLWFVWSDRGVAGNFGIISSRGLRKAWPLLRDGAIAGVVIGILVYLFLLPYRPYSHQFVVFRYQPHIPWLVSVFVWFLFVTLVAFFILGLFLYRIATMQNWKRVTGSLVFALCAGIVVGILTVVFFNSTWVHGYDYEKEMVETLRLPYTADEPPKTVVLFGDNEYRIGTKELVYTRGSALGAIALNKPSVEAVTQFMEGRNHRTFLARQMNEYVNHYYTKNWQIEPLLRYYQQAFEAGDDVRACLRLLFFLIEIIPSAEKKRILILLTDESKYSITGGASYLLGNIYAHIGDSAKAASWYERAEKLGYDVRYRFPVSRVTEGTLQGSILVGGGSAPRLRIGLIREYKRLRMRRSEPAYFETLPEFLDSYIVEATDPDADGNFRFENLVDGDYFLAVMADTLAISSAWEKVSLRNAPQKITIDPDHIAVDLGAIRINTRPKAE